uniref:hypothetical protein n=1 Tax=Pricia sp. TaxID=2268138 RepID=UPI0035946DE9
MGRNKFEKQLKEQLQGREIKPSEGAWNRISQQLEVSEGPRSKRFQWYGIAAGFIGILFASLLYFTLKEPSTVPETEITDVMKDSIPLNTTSEMVQEQKSKEDNAIVETKVQQDKSIQSTSKRNQDKSIKDALVSSKDEQIKIEKIAIPLNTSKELIEAKIAEIVTQVEVLERENSTVTDAEIDSLLRDAQRQILEDKIFRDDKSVDAMALLADVEDELDRSFRDQIFDALKDGFLK